MIHYLKNLWDEDDQVILDVQQVNAKIGCYATMVMEHMLNFFNVHLMDIITIIVKVYLTERWYQVDLVRIKKRERRKCEKRVFMFRPINMFNQKIFLDPTIKIKHVGGKSVDEDLVISLEFTRNWHWMWSTFYYHKKYDGFLIAFIKVSPKFFSAFFKKLFYQLVRNSVKKNFYANRLSGLKSSILGEPSWHRPTLD